MKRGLKPRLEGITFEGTPVETVVKQVERKEIEGDFLEEANKYRKAFPGKGGRIKMESTGGSSGPPKQFNEEERFGLLVQKGGGMSVEDYLKLPDDTKRKVYKLHKGLLLLPDKALTSEIQDLIVNEVGMADYQRFLFMLYQGGYLRRDKDYGHRVIHTKTDLAKGLSPEMLAADIMAKNKIMTGFPVKRKPKKSGQRKNWGGGVGTGSGVDFATLSQAQAMSQAQVEEPSVQDVGKLDDLPPQKEGRPCQQEVTITKFTPPTMAVEPGSELSGSLDARVQGLEDGDIRMIFDMIEVLKVTRKYLPKLKRKEFLTTFASGSKYVEE